jgi:hypothetical protein
MKYLFLKIIMGFESNSIKMKTKLDKSEKKTVKKIFKTIRPIIFFCCLPTSTFKKMKFTILLTLSFLMYAISAQYLIILNFEKENCVSTTTGQFGFAVNVLFLKKDPNR